MKTRQFLSREDMSLRLIAYHTVSERYLGKRRGGLRHGLDIKGTKLSGPLIPR